MASQMLASVKGMSACTTPNEASASTIEASCGVSADPDLRQDADRPLPARGRAAQAQSHCRSGWRGRCGAGFEDPGCCASLPWPSWLSGAVSGDRDDILATSM